MVAFTAIVSDTPITFSKHGDSEYEMKSLTGKALSLIALAGMILPAQAFDQPAPAAKAAIADVALTANGELQGLIVRRTGEPVAAEVVRVLHNGKVVAAAKSDTNGRYTIRGLRPGTHQIKTAGTEQICRLWHAQTAPPTAKKGLVTAEGTVVRGQLGGIEFGSTEMIGLVLFGGVTAVTLATTLDNDDDAPASP